MSDSGSVTVNQDGKVLVATMDDGKANALSTSLIGEVREVLDRAEVDDGIRAVVIAGRPGRFSGGFDLGVIQSGGREAAAEMVAAGGRLVVQAYGSGVPVVAACVPRCSCRVPMPTSPSSPRCSRHARIPLPPRAG